MSRNILYFGLLFLVNASAGYKFDTKWFTVPLDHFSFQRNETFKMKYLENNEYWDQSGGPIFFYTGNEGQIELFANHTGFMWEIAPAFQAKIVFAEHRYYGETMPFGKNTSLDNAHIGYLTAAQALADYAELLTSMGGGTKYPVITFGGSYGGMLSAYFRMKYPHIVAGAIAASAPIHMYNGMVPCEAFARIVTSSYKIANANCSTNIRNSWDAIKNFSKETNSSDWFKTNWRLCDPVKNATDVDTLLDFLEDMFTTMAMVNYPFSSDFLMPLPAQPVRTVCQYLSEKLSGKALLEAIAKVLNVFTNYDKNNKCVQYKSSDYGNLDASGWDYQACTEMVMPMCSTGVVDMFRPKPYNQSEFSEGCHKKFGVYPRYEWAEVEFGGNRLQAASNIVFSNGLLDPWAGGGILNSISETVQAVVLIDTAHHLDLMPSNAADPQSVRAARDFHKQNIKKWIRNFKDAQLKYSFRYV